MDSGRRKFTIVVAGVVLLAIVAVVVVSLHRPAQTVREMTVAASAFQIALPESGVAQYPQVQTMSSQVAGNIGRVFVRAGQRVDAGALLVTLVNPEVLSDAQSSAAAYRAAAARAKSAEVTGGSGVVAAQANLAAARARLAQAREDAASGVESAQGFGETTAAAQRAQAEANFTTAATALQEARRVYVAYQNLYDNKAISRDQFDQAQAKYVEAQAAYHQALLARNSVGVQLSRSQAVIADNLRSAQEGYAQAQAALSAALVESGSGDVAAASAEASRAGSEYALAQEQADSTKVRAPYDAIVLSVSTEKTDSLRPLQPGDAIGAGQPLVTLAARRAFVVRTRVDEQDVINVRLGERARITGEDFPGRQLSGHVVEISPIAQKTGDSPSTGQTFATTIAVDRPPAFLRDGMSVDAAILTTDLRQALVVPNEAIVRAAGATSVYVVRDGKAYRQPVSLGPSNETSTVVASGLRAGDVIVAQSIDSLADGTAVQPAVQP